MNTPPRHPACHPDRRLRGTTPPDGIRLETTDPDWRGLDRSRSRRPPTRRARRHGRRLHRAERWDTWRPRLAIATLVLTAGLLAAACAIGLDLATSR
jgi:hypothetical protein